LARPSDFTWRRANAVEWGPYPIDRVSHAAPSLTLMKMKRATVGCVTATIKRITVLLADDNKVVRTEFRKLLELEDDLEVVGEVNNGRQAVAMVKKRRPAVVLMDVAMLLVNGLEATREMLKACPTTRVLMLSAHSDDAYIVEAMNSGARGYLVKQTAANCVCHAIREVQKGNTFFSPSIPRHLYNGNRIS